MRNEIFKQIKNNRSTFYSELNNQNRTNPGISDKQFKSQNKKACSNNSRISTNQAIDILNIIFHKFSLIRIPNFGPLHFGKKNKETFFKITTYISQFVENINQYFKQKTDNLIEQCYELGSRVFDDNIDSFHSHPNHIELVPDISSNYKVGYGSQKSNEHIIIKFDRFEITEAFKNLKKNILIYLESDTFTFSKINRTGEPAVNKEISYESKSQDVHTYTEFLFSMLRKVDKQKSKNVRLIKLVFQQLSIVWSRITSSLQRFFSNSKKLRLFPILNRFI